MELVMVPVPVGECGSNGRQWGWEGKSGKTRDIYRSVVGSKSVLLRSSLLPRFRCINKGPALERPLPGRCVHARHIATREKWLLGKCHKPVP